MLFNSASFALFFPIVTALYFALPQRHRWGMLLAASCLFYMAFVPGYILILAITIAIDYAAGILIEGSSGRTRRLYLLVSILSTVAVLAVFKYYNFLAINSTALARALGWNYDVQLLNLILPIGLSFHTFQSLAYTIEVYRGHVPAERHPGIFALYVMFYPQLVAGPIERPQNLLHQFYEHHTFEYERVVDGLRLMAWGLFKKVVIADRLAIAVNHVYADPALHGGPALMVATVFFAFQIYCDFSGYSDMAIGAAQVMGFRLMTNFNSPYVAQSVGEFWSRWHISLSTWFRDYVYIPLGGNRVTPARHALNLMLTFLLSGLWHGAGWTYVIWGGLNGLYLVSSTWTSGLRRQLTDAVGLGGWPVLHRILRVAMTFTLICVSWVFFRASSVGDALFVLKRALATVVIPATLTRASLDTLNRELGLRPWELVVLIAALGVLAAVRLAGHEEDIRSLIRRQPTRVRWAAYYGLVLWICFFGVFNDSAFIYFQF